MSGRAQGGRVMSREVREGRAISWEQHGMSGEGRQRRKGRNDVKRHRVEEVSQRSIKAELRRRGSNEVKRSPAMRRKSIHIREGQGMPSGVKRSRLASFEVKRPRRGTINGSARRGTITAYDIAIFFHLRHSCLVSEKRSFGPLSLQAEICFFK